MAARGINKVTLIGNLGGDPEIRSTQGGTTVANFRLATNERRKKGDAWEDHTEWHRIVAFGRLAEICRDFLTKGRQVYIDGSIRTNKWQDKEGNERYTTEIIANELQMLGGRGDGGTDNGEWARDKGKAGAPADGGGSAMGGELDDSEIPFAPTFW